MVREVQLRLSGSKEWMQLGNCEVEGGADVGAESSLMDRLSSAGRAGLLTSRRRGPDAMIGWVYY